MRKVQFRYTAETEPFVAKPIKTPAGKWKAVVRKRGWPTASKTFRTQRDAIDWARRVEDEMVRGVYIDRSSSERMMFEQAMDRYLAEVVPTKKPSTQETDSYCAKPLRAYFGKYSLAAVSPELVASYRDARLATPITRLNRKTGEITPVLDPRTSKPRRLSANTVRLELALLGHMFNTAIKEWGTGLVRNPVSSIRKPSPGEGRDRRLSAGEETRLREAIASYSNPMLGWIFTIAIETGMRSGEIAGLKIRQVDTDRRIVRLDSTKNDSPRTVPLSIKATEAFVAALANPTRPDGCELVFFGEPRRQDKTGQDRERKDDERGPYTFAKAWRGIKTSLGLSDLRFHDLRHEAVSRLVEAGFSDQEVSAISGHKSMQMLKRYTHLRAEDLVSKLDRIDKVEEAAEPSKANAQQ